MSSPSTPTPIAGPTGSVGPANAVDKIKLLDLSIYNLLNVTELILKTYIDKGEILKLTFDTLNLRLNSDVEIQVLNEQFNLYKKFYVMATPDQKINLHLKLFDKILSEKSGVLLQSINNDSWIKSNLIRIMIGEDKGATSKLCLHLGQFYRIALSIEQHHRNKMKDYPELYKEGPELLYPQTVLYHTFKIFKLTDAATEENKSRAIAQVIANLEKKLGINQGSQNPLSMISGIMDSVMPVGVDLLNKHQSVQGGAKIQPDQLKNVVNRMFQNDNMQNMINSIQGSARGGAPPDMGTLVGNILQNVNPATMFEDLQNVVKQEIPQIVPPENRAPTTEKTEKSDKTEEIIEETIEEEIVEEP